MDLTELLIHASDVDEQTMAQIRGIASHPAIEGLVAIMPDCHLGAGCVIGFTGRFSEAVIPNVVGVDIGCGVVLNPIEGVERREIDFDALDRFIRSSIPLGMTHHRTTALLEWFGSRAPEKYAMAKDLVARADKEFHGKLLSRRPRYPAWGQLGTLGGGNHFIEIDEDQEGSLFLTVHSGSRHFGFQVANFFQDMARRFQSRSRESDGLPRGLEHLPLDKGGREYLKWLRIAQEFALMNRSIIAERILSFFGKGLDERSLVESVHNYISERDGIVRKGAISAHKGERVVIPLSMASGVVLGIGKGNPSFNYSAPHGAGRLFGRKEMKRRLKEGAITMGSFKKSMEGVFSTSLSSETIDESPMAYRRWEDISDEVKETVEVTALLKPVYNLKSPE
ncbi:MAG: RtcB family protein [Thermovirgaceae bacterium]|jgi:tRNA-splicing ligase RtcB|nr:RtcB family protein [Synergistales bacterium]HRW87336.1 RtcB family protein [Thermovirgaceae bacterium]MDD3133617.1 RtcB family protein [Synergistales bacterium]MDD3830792.1 RtcB family protein [Synergistales bacterium]MDD4022727.1 RtcB family protein [Synergistales bacterium]